MPSEVLKQIRMAMFRGKSQLPTNFIVVLTLNYPVLICAYSILGLIKSLKYSYEKIGKMLQSREVYKH